MTIRVALVGCGAIASVVCRGYEALRGEAKIVAAVDHRAERAKAVAVTIGATPYPTLADALREADVDAVDVRVPHIGHAAVTHEAIAAGRHVLVDKPMAATLADARSLIDAAEAAGVTLAVAENYSFFEPVRVAADAIAGGAIGELLLARTDRVVGLGGVWLQDGWRLQPEGGGGVLLDQGPHFTNVLRRTVGEIAAVHAMASTRAPGWSVEDSAVVTCRFESGLIGQQLYTFASPTPSVPPEATFYGSAGSLEIHTGYGAPTSRLVLHTPDGPPGGAVLVDGIDYDDTFAPAIADWLAACRGERPATMSGTEGARDLAVIDAAHRSLRSGAEEPVLAA